MQEAMKTIGAIYADDAWVDCEAAQMVEEFCRFLPRGVQIISAGTYVAAEPNTLQQGIRLAENGEIEEAARRLSRYRPDTYAYYCTTVSFARGPGGDLDIAQRITHATGKPATTTSTGMIAALRHLNIQRVALASPYLSDVQERFVSFIEAHGIRVVGHDSLRLEQAHSRVEPQSMKELVESVDCAEAEAIFVGCTGQKLAHLLNDLEATMGKPVLTACQVTTWHACRMLGVAPWVVGRGALLKSA